MLSVEGARAVMLGPVASLPSERVPLERALGRTLAEAVVSTRDQPPFAASAMDGYALARADLIRAAAEGLPVVGESAAGHGYAATLAPGEAVRIFTGAPLPDGADTVVVQEEVVRDGGRMRWTGATASDFVRPRGIDFTAGRTLLRVGTRLDGIALALAAASGAAELAVARRARVALLAGGDEIVPPGAPAGPQQVYDSVTYGLAALIHAWGGEAVRLPPVSDDLGALSTAADQAQTSADLLVCIGGASVGDHDLIKPALAALGLALAVDTVAVRPGKPTWFGRTLAGPVLGLPGNPASALVCAHLFLRPLLAALHGADPAPLTTGLPARLTEPLPANGPREHYLRAHLSVGPDAVLSITPFERQDSSLLSVFADADALLRRSAHDPARGAGEIVEVLRLSRS